MPPLPGALPRRPRPSVQRIPAGLADALGIAGGLPNFVLSEIVVPVLDIERRFAAPPRLVVGGIVACAVGWTNILSLSTSERSVIAWAACRIGLLQAVGAAYAECTFALRPAGQAVGWGVNYAAINSAFNAPAAVQTWFPVGDVYPLGAFSIEPGAAFGIQAQSIQVGTTLSAQALALVVEEPVA